MNSGKDPVGWRKIPTGDKIKRVQTFICFSILSGDRKRIREVHSFLTDLLLDFVLLSYLLTYTCLFNSSIHPCIHSLIHSFSEPLNPTTNESPTNNGDFSSRTINHHVNFGVAFRPQGQQRKPKLTSISQEVKIHHGLSQKISNSEI